MAAVAASPQTTPRWAPIALPSLRLSPDLLKIVPLALALLASPVIYLGVTSEAVTVGTSVEGLRSDLQHWRYQNRQLELELSKHQSLTWVENEAVSRLGMRRPPRPIYLNVSMQRPGASRTLPAPLARYESTEISPSAPVVGSVIPTLGGQSLGEPRR